MLKKVVLTNVYTSKSTEVIVDTDEDVKAVLGAGKAPNETAVVADITGLDEALQRSTGKNRASMRQSRSSAGWPAVWIATFRRSKAWN
ncbi:MAG: hypothetical protein ACOYNN_01260 [Terrimicrobiaceae bacterium]